MNGKKWVVSLLALGLALCLTACRDSVHFEGLVTEIQKDGDDVSFVLEDRRGERTGVRIAEKTSAWPREREGTWANEELRAAFLGDLREDMWVSAWCYPRREKLETAAGEKVRAYWGQSVYIEGELRREAAALRDGTKLDVLDLDAWESHIYRLADGTELLEVQESRGPENIQVINLDGFESLNEAAQEKVRAWYEARGELYDEAEELERCYAAYRELGEDFSSSHIRQEVRPTASGERVIYFTTELLLPIDYDAREYRASTFQTAFDRETGEEIDPWDLFAAPEAEVRRRLPELVGWDITPSLREKMAEALEPEWIRFTSNGLDICFPTGSLPGREIFPDEESGELRVTEYHLDIDWRNIPEDFLQPWAVPDSWGEEEP